MFNEDMGKEIILMEENWARILLIVLILTLVLMKVRQRMKRRREGKERRSKE
jgi:hypothetical protein